MLAYSVCSTPFSFDWDVIEKFEPTLAILAILVLIVFLPIIIFPKFG